MPVYARMSLPIHMAKSGDHGPCLPAEVPDSGSDHFSVHRAALKASQPAFRPSELDIRCVLVDIRRAVDVAGFSAAVGGGAETGMANDIGKAAWPVLA